MGESIVTAVDGVDVKINKGDFLAITGPSGSGKSTMMNLVGALDLATKGEIYLDGQDIEHLEESELAQIRGRKIGFIFQSFNLVPTLNAKENIMLPMMFQDYSDEERNERAESLLAQVGLSPRKNHLPKELSGGERQRLAIARALLRNPEVIIFDEATSSLDSLTEKEITETIKKVSKSRPDLIVISIAHRLSTINHSDIIYVLENSKIIEKGTHKTLLEKKGLYAALWREQISEA